MDINVTAKKVTIDKGNIVNKGEYNIRDCNFTLSEEYDGLVCKALFTVEKTNKTYEKSIVNNKCTIPYEVTVEKGAITLGVIGYEIQDDELIKRYSPLPYHFTIEDGSYIEDIENQSTPTPSELEQLEQRVSAIEIDAEQVEINTQNISNLQENKADKSELEDFITKDVDDLTYYTLTTQTGSQIELSLNSTNFKMTATLKDKNGNTVDTSNEIDLPLESVVVNASYDSATKEIVLTLQNGNTVRFSVADLVSGLISDTDYPTSSKAGVIKVDTAVGTYVNNGLLGATTKSFTNYNNLYNDLIIGKGTLENVIAGKELINKPYVDNYIQKLETENTRFKATLPTTTGSGENITLDKTAEMEFIQPPLPRGNSKQVQYSGKNLLNLVIAADTKGLTITKNEDGTITLNGTTSYGGVIYISEDFTTIANQDYTISSHVKSGTTTDNPHTTFWNGVASAWFFDVSVGTSQTKQYSSPVTHKFSIYVNANKTYTNYTIDIQVELGSTATAYEPYVGGTASPNPSYPQEITNVTGDVEVLVQNKNLAWNGWAEDFVTRINDNTKAKLETKDGRSCLLFGANAGYGDYDNKYIFKTNWKENTQYTIVFSEYITSNNGFGNIEIQYTDGTTTEISSLTQNAWNNVVKSSTANKTIEYIKVIWRGGDNWIDLNTFMVLEGAYTAQTIPTYVPHAQQSFTFPLGNQRMYLGDYLADDGIHHKRKQIEITAENVNDLITSNVATEYGHKRIFIGKNELGWKTSWSSGIALINKYTEVSSTSNVKSGTYGTNFAQSYVSIFDDRFTDLATARQLLIGTIIEIEQANEWIEPYTTEQQTAYDEIKQALSYEEQTNISGSSNEANPIFSVEAYQSIKLVLAG